ncbi:Amidinotransferase [Oesophagostomum dentatum]|uniref:Amidinotransferase n=1 Tax=Oesophagostomum dentatum TaxID=61180 RepID=A0A0B1T9U8_OESDE|nr:Amidinotransferase [Oesophagostomum dentatum]
MTDVGFRILMFRPTYFKVFYAINPWMSVNNPVDEAKAVKQWEKLKETIEKCGARTVVMEPDESAKNLPDIVFTANAGIVRENRVYLANFTHEQRKPEWKINDKWFKENGFTTFFNPNIPHEGTGDALWINKGKVLIAGIGPRSDIRAIDDIHKKLRGNGEDFMVLAVKLIDPR